jgi:hypothetical protein
LFDNLTEEDVIYDVFNRGEVSEKIKYLLKNPNNKRLMNGFKKEFITTEWQSGRWQEIVDSIISLE